MDTPPPTALLPLPDGRLVVVTVLRQWREDGRWRATVEWTQAGGEKCYQSRWCDELRPVASVTLLERRTTD